MSRKIVRLTLDHLETIGAPCRSCLFWELDLVRRGRVSDACGEKDAWVGEVLREWGSCGRVALVDDELAGYLIYAPTAFVPGAAVSPPAPASADAVVMTTAYVAPAHRGGGLGRMLVQGMASDLIRRGGIAAVEAFGDLSGSDGHCTVPVDFLTSVGFKTHRAHPLTPRLRMDLRTAVSWRDEVEAALERIVEAVRPATRPKATRGPTPGSARASR